MKAAHIWVDEPLFTWEMCYWFDLKGQNSWATTLDSFGRDDVCRSTFKY